MKNRLVSFILAMLLLLASSTAAFAVTTEEKNHILWDMIYDDVVTNEWCSSELHTLYNEGCDCDVQYADPELEGQYLRKVLKILDLMIEDSSINPFVADCDHVGCVGTNVVLYGPWTEWLYYAEENLCKQRSRLVIIVCSDCDEFIIAVEYNDDCDHSQSLQKKGYCEDCGYLADDEPTHTTPQPATTNQPKDEPNQPKDHPTTCKHSETKTSTNKKWTVVGTEEKCRLCTITTTVICKKCGKTISTDFIEEYDNSHSFDEYNTCTKCGYTKPLGEAHGIDHEEVPHQENETEFKAPEQDPNPLGEGENSGE